ncbi:uncharacterized protein LOC127244396 isoform X2 [Andrographis paniculata]|uniref:uncharacterized protein LOC127244396 isoform X2 n=1 Tax=Andrographis paniculata TaxID=175694 RepID=UPI0021E85DDB|nr:uncharacterized protein LOC127244396 isoform X2 [Andrographis paniculata]XP_051120876.1 uncharacterized protein LOC127244396 isoform X2 [Andrographis paniculata]
MGFDIECIIDIHTYPGEYFCPVCRTLVYPNEAFQSQCTHLYCKPCLAHIANGTKACPYDGYLVTEADSKPLKDSDKTLAENIGKVKVHCLYFRSGCTWEGSLSDCSSHCSLCSFGNSPVICNRCGIQIVHRQVHDHAQSCLALYGAQQAVAIVATTTRPGTAAAAVTAETNQTVSQSGALTQVQTQNVAATLATGQNPIQQVNANSQAPATAPVNVPTPDQWYQQQYQQYYQQYMGYYQQQPAQQYYQIQQQPLQQYQQNASQVPGQIQPQTQPQSVPQPHLLPQAQLPQPLPAQVQSQQQSNLHPLPVSQAPQQPQMQMQVQVQGPPQTQVQGQVPVQGAASHQLNPAHPPLRPQTQQATLPPPPQGQSGPALFPYGMRPAAQPQPSQYHRPTHTPTQYHTPQIHPQPPIHQPQPQAQPVSVNLPHVQTQPQVQSYPTPSPAPAYAPQATANHQSTGATALPPAPPHSYQQPASTQKILPGSLVHQHPAAQVHGQVPQQPGVMALPSHPQQQLPTLLPGQNHVPFIPAPQHQQLLPHVTHSFQNRPVAQPVQQALPQQYGQQQHFPAPFPGQVNQQQLQPQLRPPAPPQLQQQAQNYSGRPVMPSQVSHSFSSGVGASHQVSSAQFLKNQNYVKSNHESVQEARSPLRAPFEKGAEGEILKEKAATGQIEIISGGADNAAKDSRNMQTIKQEDMHSSLDQQAVGKSFDTGGMVNNEADSNSSKLVNPENQKLSAAIGLSSVNYGKNTQTGVIATGTEGPIVPQRSTSARPEVQVHGRPFSVHPPQGQGAGGMPHPGQSANQDEGRPQGYYGPPKGFEPQSTTHGPTYPSQAHQHGIIGKVLPNDGQRSTDQMSGIANQSGSGEGTVKSQVEEPTFIRKNAEIAPESIYGSKDDKSTAMAREHLNPLTASRPLDKAPHGQMHEAGLKMNPSSMGPPRFLPPHGPSGGHGSAEILGGGPEFGQHHLKQFPRRSPGQEYFSSPLGFGDPASFPRGTSAFDDNTSREVHGFREGPRPFNLSTSLPRNPFHDGRFPPLSGHLDGTGNPRFAEYRAPGNDAVFGQDGPPHLGRGKYSGPGNFPGNFGMPESAGPGGLPVHGRGREVGGPATFPRLPFNEPVRGDRFGHFGDPSMHNNYPFPGFPNAGSFSTGMESFEPWKRKPVSNGWCRICGVDCESVEGLELHSQTRDHQKIAMDMVKSIKMQNKKPRMLP